MNQPARTFVLAALVVGILLSLYQLPTLSVGGIELRPVRLLSGLLPEPTDRFADSITLTQSTPAPVRKTENGGEAEFTERWSDGVMPIVDYAGGQAGGMDHFYEALATIDSLQRPVRIAYYGDSYIEGDILTADLREMFQAKFGGNGVGWVDCGSEIVAARRSIVQRYSGLTEFLSVKPPFDRRLQGPAERYYTASEGARIHTAGTRFYAHAARWSVSRLFLRTRSSVNVEATTGRGHSVVQRFEADPQVQMFEITDTTRAVDYRFSNVGERTELLGMALESERGVVLDNFSMRGSSGITLARIPLPTLKDFNRLRPYDLIVIHFGLNNAVSGNTVPVLRLYMAKMKRVVRHLREAFPQASILVMSVPDREQRSADGIRTLREVHQLVAYQQRLAQECGVAYLNFFSAMGGEGSVADLVAHGMANKDYTHLSFGGGRVVARRIFPSFVEGLDNYRQRRKAVQLKNRTGK